MARRDGDRGRQAAASVGAILQNGARGRNLRMVAVAKSAASALNEEVQGGNFGSSASVRPQLPPSMTQGVEVLGAAEDPFARAQAIVAHDGEIAFDAIVPPIVQTSLF